MRTSDPLAACRPGLARVLSLTAALALALAPSTAAARTAATDRILRNVTIAIDSVKPDPALAAGPISANDRPSATNLLRDLDYALGRADDLGRIAAEDQHDPEVVAITARIEQLRRYRDQLAKHLDQSRAAGAALDAMYRAFRDDARPYAGALAVFPEASGSAQVAINVSAARLATAMQELATLDQLCTTRYAGLAADPKLTFQLAFDPIAVCATAANRQRLAVAMVEASVRRDLTRWQARLDEARTSLQGTDGFVPISGNVMDELIHDRPAAMAGFLALHQPYFAAVSMPVPADLLKPLDQAADALWAEIDRLAPTYSFPRGLRHDSRAEAGARAELPRRVKGSKVIKTGVLFADWTVARTGAIPTERYRTGAILFKTARSKWCQYREFTAHAAYQGGGRYATHLTYTFAGLRYQTCK